MTALYEYKILEGNDLPNEENLHVLDAKGWELVQIVPHAGRFYLYMRRLRSRG